MMAEIEEIPLDQIENTENNQEIMLDNEEIVENIEEQPAPKKKGRPPGAKNKPKPPAPKPKPKPKAKVKKQLLHSHSELSHHFTVVLLWNVHIDRNLLGYLWCRDVDRLCVKLPDYFLSWSGH